MGESGANNNTHSAGRTAGRPRSSAPSRETTVRAVVDLIAAKGFNGWSMRDLAEEVGVSLGTLTYHFRDKQELLAEALDSTYVVPADWDNYRKLPQHAQLHRMVDYFIVDNVRRRRGWRFWLEYMAAAGYNADLRQRHEERYHRQRRFFGRVIAAGVETGDLVTELAPEREADRFIALGNGLVVQQLVTPSHLNPAAAREVLEQYIRGLQRKV